MNFGFIARALLVAAALSFGSPAAADEARPNAPDFTLRSLSGDRVKLSDFKDKVVLMSFWATWCGPCKQELPVLQALLDKYGKDGLAVVAVNIDDPKTVADVRRFVADRKFTFPVLLDGDSKVLSKFNPRVQLPYMAVIDQNGKRAAHHTGFSSGAEKALEQEVLSLLAEKKKPEAVATP